MKLKYFDTLGAEDLLSAIPMRKLPGKAVAEIAVALAALSRVNKEFREACSKAADKIKPEGYEEKVQKRQEEINSLFPEGKAFDPEVWEKKCKDPDFEKVFMETEGAFSKAANEIGRTDTEVKIRISPETLGSIAEVMASEETVKVGNKGMGESEIPYDMFIRQIALLVE